ncbi:MAG: aldehyde ferredoxin oxidoreductase N-terminal domain-containing protein, partial [Halobacteriota archaeon]
MGLPDTVLRVDLTEGRVTTEAVPPSWRRDFIGGKGLGARYLYEEVVPEIDPLDPENVLCLFRGPFSGYLPGETRYVAITKSPLTGLFVDSYSGGSFADAFVGALGEHAGLLIEGRAPGSVAIIVEDATATITDAEDRWGLDVRELDASFDGAVAGIGPAGESSVRYATIATDGGDHHAGRGGTGAVMGVKRLKAVVARGTPPERADLEAVRDRYASRFEATPEGRA